MLLICSESWKTFKLKGFNMVVAGPKNHHCTCTDVLMKLRCPPLFS